MPTIGWIADQAVRTHEQNYHHCEANTPERLRWQKIEYGMPPEDTDVLLWDSKGFEGLSGIHFCIVGQRQGNEYIRIMASGMCEWTPTHWAHIPPNDRI